MSLPPRPRPPRGRLGPLAVDVCDPARAGRYRDGDVGSGGEPYPTRSPENLPLAVGIDVETSIAGQSGSGTVLGDLGILQMVVPVLLLVLAGFLVARTAAPRDATEGAKAGLTVVPGYLILALVLALGSSWSFSESAAGVSASASIAPELLPAVLLAGILYPAVFGALGGAAAGGTGR